MNPYSYSLRLLLALSLPAIGGIATVLQAAPVTHTLSSGGGTGTWNNAGNWTNGIPNLAGDIAAYSTATTAAPITLDSAVSGNSITIGKISKTASGSWTINAGTASGFTIDNTGGTGVAAIQNTSGSGGLTINPTVNLINSDLDVISSGGSVSVPGNISAGSSQTITFKNNATGTITVGGSIGASGSGISLANTGSNTGSVTLSGNLGANVGSITQNSSAGSTLILSGSNSSYAGNVTISAGVLQAGSVTALNSNNTVTLSGGKLDFNNSVTIAGLTGSSGTVTTSGAALRVLTLGGSGNYALATGITPTAGNPVLRTSIAVALTGSGTQTLGAAGTYAGGTSVTSGTLILTNTTGSATGTGALTVSGSGKVGGTGIIAPTGSNGISLASGSGIDLSSISSTGTFTIDLGGTTGNAGFAGGSVFKFDLAPSDASDTLAFLGLADASTVTFNSNTVTVVNPVPGLFTLFTFDNANDYSGTLSATVSGLSVGQSASFIYNTNSIQLSVVPEPSGIATVAAGFAMLLGFGRIRNRK